MLHFKLLIQYPYTGGLVPILKNEMRNKNRNTKKPELQKDFVACQKHEVSLRLEPAVLSVLPFRCSDSSALGLYTG